MARRPRVPPPTDDLDALARELIETPDVAEGRRPPSRRATPEQAVELVNDLYGAHEAAARHLPVLAERMGHTIACKAGCAECCHELIGVSHAEAYALASWLAEPAQAALRARVVERARSWVAAAGARAEAALGRMAAGDEEGYAALRREHALAHILCPANEDGMCAVYPARPLVCRLPYVVDTAEHCGARVPQGPPAQLITSEGYERLQAAARRLMSGLEATLGHPPRGRRSLPAALLEELARTGST
jgi:Fe-S-cluster containining protein